MKPKSVITSLLLSFVALSGAFLIVTELRSPRPSSGDTAAADPASGPAGAAPSASTAHRVVAYYFHNTQRCATCLKIERWAKETLEDRFGEALQRGELQWQAIDMQQPAHEHFAETYQLVTSSLVLVDLRGGEQRAWITLDKVWELVSDETAFKEYVATHTRHYLES